MHTILLRARAMPRANIRASSITPGSPAWFSQWQHLMPLEPGINIPIGIFMTLDHSIRRGLQAHQQHLQPSAIR
jgi:hypothetical protein